MREHTGQITSLFFVFFILDRFDDDDDDDDDGGGRGGGEGEGVGTFIIDKGDGDLDVPETTLLSDAFAVDEEGFFTIGAESIESESRILDGASCGLTTNEGDLPLTARGLVDVVVDDDDKDDEEEFFARASATS